MGKAKNAQKRLKRHIQERTLKRPVCKWVQSLIVEGKCPVVRVLETVPMDQWEAAERRLIAEHRKSSDLLNLADGGAMPSQTIEQRKGAARASNKSQLERSPEWLKLQRAKLEIGKTLANMMRTKAYWHAYQLRFHMRLWAFDRPDLYGAWANL